MNINNIPYKFNAQGPADGRQPEIYDYLKYGPPAMALQRQQHAQAPYNANDRNGTMPQPKPFTSPATNAMPAQNFIGPSIHIYGQTHVQQQSTIPVNPIISAPPQPQIQQKPSAIDWKGRAEQAEAWNNTLNVRNTQLQSQLEQTSTDLQNANRARQQLDIKNKELEKQIANLQKGRENATAIAHQMVDLKIGS